MNLPCTRRTPRPGRTPPVTAAGTDPELRLSVWATAQRDARTQRRGRYLPAATAHPGKMLPAIAATAIRAYSAPGDLVADPMCGIGTTLIEAVHLGRDALGIEYEPRWAELAAAGINHARRHGAPGTGHVVCGDARQLPQFAPAPARGKAALVVTSPPYGPSVHGQVHAGAGGVRKYDNRYSRDPVNLAHHGIDALVDGITRILGGCVELLKPGGVVVVAARPWRHRGELVDLPGAIIATACAGGLTPIERCVALLAGLDSGHLVPRPSFFQLENTRKARASTSIVQDAGGPLRVGSMCTGYGGLDLAVMAVLDADLAWCADNDPHASAVLAARFPHAPNQTPQVQPFSGRLSSCRDGCLLMFEQLRGPVMRRCCPGTALRWRRRKRRSWWIWPGLGGV